MFYGQYKQDEYVYEKYFKNITNGVFLDIGASDGITFSNTLFFEKLGWSGLCVEPRKSAYDNLIKIRNCYCENIGLSNIEGTFKFQDISGWGSGLSGIINNYDPKHLERIKREIKHPKYEKSMIIDVQVVTLQSLLDKYNLHNIDFMSLDVEGSELPILKSIDWKKTKIKVICVENNYNKPDIRNFLYPLGYKYVTRIACDEVYILST